MDAQLKKKPKKQKANKKGKRAKQSPAELATERKARAAAKDAQGKLVVEIRRAKPHGGRSGNTAATAGSVPGKGNGLTIAEQVARAKKKVRAVEADVAAARQNLLKLERQLADAQKQLNRAENLPRRSALGQALAKAVEPERQS